jgi:hypothetical protein
MLRRVALVRTDVPEELDPSIIRVTRICEKFSETSVLKRTTPRIIPEGAILQFIFCIVISVTILADHCDRAIE